MKVLTRTLIEESEKNAVDNGAFSFRELMKIAGSKAAEIILSALPCRDKKITVICGNGNNGGDGFVVANILKSHGANVKVMTPLGAPLTENAKFYYDKLEPSVFCENLPLDSDIVIDALFGIGLSRPLGAELCELLEKVNALECKRIAIDIPSGVECDSGKVLGTAFQADITVTFIALKPCFVLPDGSDFCGEVTVADIGVAPVKSAYDTIKAPVFKKRRHNSHKGNFGTALIIAGSYGMAGAAILASKAALRSGLGIAKCVVCDGIYQGFTAALPEAVCIPVPMTDCGSISPDAVDITALTKKCTALLFGPGISKCRYTEEILFGIIKNNTLPAVIDADGINLLSDNIELLCECKAPVILTPHPAEMARLCAASVEEVETNRIEIARNFAKKYNCILVLKGANTIVASPEGEISFNLTGNPGMSTGGSGDVLAGIIVSLLAQGFSPIDAAKYGVFLHGKAGDEAAAKHGERGMLPSDIIEEL